MLDLLIRGATVFPGDGPPRLSDVGVVDGRIAAVGRVPAGAAAGVDVEAAGLVLCPGFVDMHAHTALLPFDDALLAPKVAQGFTTEVINPDGLAPAPVAPDGRDGRKAYLRALEGDGPAEWPWTTFAEYLEALDATRPATSLVPGIGHGAVRDLVLGGAAVQPDDAQLQEMRRQVRIGIEAGARTLSFGLIYLPAAYATTSELEAVAEIAAEHGVPLVPHVRNEGSALLEAMEEMIGVARRTGASLHVSHLKSLADERLIEPLLELLDRASAEIPLTFDQYPYGAGSTLLAALLPAWAQEGGAEGTLMRLRSRGERRQITHDVVHGLPGWENILGTLGPGAIVIADAASPRAEAIGRSLDQIAAARGEEPVEAVLELLLETELDVTMISHYASEEAVRRIARHRLQLVGSDGIFGARPHPRLYGTAARFLGRFAAREGLVPVEEAVARLTSRPADLLGLSDRGRIAEGKRADLVLLDLDRFVDTATYDDPKRHPEGVVGVWVAGESVWRDGRHTGARPGGVVRR
jgi:N-acyl-D-amino-acid deacylase